MPWKGEKDPYKIWLSEIILQQTRVEQGLSYYNNFIVQFPTVEALAKADDDLVFKAWEGLGYYSRCKNLIATAKKIYLDHKGVFPISYAELLKLKGVGPYTAAAIASFAYRLPHAVVDGNVLRVLSRFFGLDAPVDNTTHRKKYNELANELIVNHPPDLYNQAIMDFGAVVCKPASPLCSACPLQPDCAAFKQNAVSRLPIKEKILVRKKRWFCYFVFEVDQFLLVRKRTEKDIWENLHEFFLVESDRPRKWSYVSANKYIQNNLDISTFHITDISEVYKQQLTHQNIEAQFIYVRLQNVPDSLNHFERTKLFNGQPLAFPKLLNEYLQQSYIKKGSLFSRPFHDGF